LFLDGSSEGHSYGEPEEKLADDQSPQGERRSRLPKGPLMEMKARINNPTTTEGIAVKVSETVLQACFPRKE